MADGEALRTKPGNTAACSIPARGATKKGKRENANVNLQHPDQLQQGGATAGPARPQLPADKCHGREDHLSQHLDLIPQLPRGP